ncbi:conjugative transposon protein TraM [Bacteroides fragilis]|uniref:conjugative transposon protein TraM n=1 Tax=Bacteroides fragilis TaxID=817 RepID=UPI001C7095B9|nr:conjugative transposon protein TraM [Bacteroides fragilis]MBW9280230.1 conjugative transposon protein TraM [Bacteroides fragilis]
MNKTKVIIFSVIALLVIVMILGVIKATSGEKKESSDMIDLGADVPKEFSYEDMMASNDKKGRDVFSSGTEEKVTSVSTDLEDVPVTDSYYQRESADVRRIQQQILENNAEQEALQEEKKKKLKKIDVPDIEPVVIDTLKENTVKAVEVKDTLQQIPEKVNGKKKRFFSVNMNKQNTHNAIRAVVHGDQEVTSGSTLKMRLLEDCVADDGTRIPKNSEVFGIVNLSGERAQVEIQSVKIGGTIAPFSKSVFGSDAIAGIYIPGSVKADIAKEAASDGISGVSTGSVISSTGIIGDVVGSVLDAGKSVISRNIRKNSVTIKTNYEIYLR